MTKLTNALQQWGSDAFNQTLQSEIEQLKGQNILPLKDAIDDDNYVIDYDLGATVINIKEEDNAIKAVVGIYFAEEVSCCSCGEGSPTEEAYCEMDVIINKASAEAEFVVHDSYRKTGSQPKACVPRFN